MIIVFTLLLAKCMILFEKLHCSVQSQLLKFYKANVIEYNVDRYQAYQIELVARELPSL